MKVTDYFSKKATIVSFIMSIFVIYIHANNLSYYGIAANGRTVHNIDVNLCGGDRWNCGTIFLYNVSLLALSV